MLKIGQRVVTGSRTKDSRLKRNARATARRRGHDMTPFRADSCVGRRVYDSSCKRCGADMRVTTWPLANEIEISGAAVALNCTKESGA